MIDAVLYGAVVFLVLNVLVSLVRVVRGPSDHDRLLALLLMSTTAVGVLALLAHLAQVPALRDAALALVALAALVVLARIRTVRARRAGSDREGLSRAGSSRAGSDRAGSDQSDAEPGGGSGPGPSGALRGRR